MRTTVPNQTWYDVVQVKHRITGLRRACLKIQVAMNRKNILVMGLALLLSPIPACAQMVCDIDCSLHRAVARDVGAMKEPTSAEQRDDAEHAKSRSAHRHCDEALSAADSVQKDREPVQHLTAVCHRANCATELGQSMTANAQIPQRIASAGLPPTTKMNGRPLLLEPEPRNFSLLDGDSAVGVVLRIGVLRI
jgi:hypothetical protein